MSRKTDGKQRVICICCMICMLLLLVPLPVFANNQGSILLKATAEDDLTVYKISNTEFTMYQVGVYKNNSWILKNEFVKSGVVFDFEDSSVQAACAKKLAKYVHDNKMKGIAETTNSNGEILYKNLEKGVYLFIQTDSAPIGERLYQSEPFIITVPGNYDGQIIWDVTAEPKFKNESIPPITPNTPPVSKKPAGGGNNSGHTTNVKTGDDTDIIRWLFLIGVSVVMFHIFRRKVRN